MKTRTSLIRFTAASLLGIVAAGGLALPDAALAKDKHHGNSQMSAGGCPPGLAKKSPACVPPGLAKKQVEVHRDRDRYEDHNRYYDRDRHVYVDRDRYDGFRYNDRYDQVYRYRVGDRITRDYVLVPTPQRYGLDPYGTYYRVGDGIYQVNKDTLEVMAIIGLASRLLN